MGTEVTLAPQQKQPVGNASVQHSVLRQAQLLELPNRAHKLEDDVQAVLCSMACLTLAAFLSSLLAAHCVYALPLAGRLSISSTAARRALSCQSLSAPCAVLHASSASLSSLTKGESRGDAEALAAWLPSLQLIHVRHQTVYDLNRLQNAAASCARCVSTLSDVISANHAGVA